MGATLSVAVGVAAGVAVIVAGGTVDVGDSTGQLPSATLTAAISSLTDTMPSVLVSNAGQSVTWELPSAMLTPRMSSLIATSPEPSQSPGHTAPARVAASKTPSTNALTTR